MQDRTGRRTRQKLCEMHALLGETCYRVKGGCEGSNIEMEEMNGPETYSGAG